MEERRNCPVCGKHEMEEAGDFEVCPICGWEDDPIQYKDPNYRGGANYMSLNEARAMYKNGVQLYPN